MLIGVTGWWLWPEKADAVPLPAGPKPDSVVTVKLAIVGDLMCHMPQFANVKVDADSFNFHRCFEEIRGVLSSADFTVGNLETTMAGVEKGFSGYPRFCAPDDYITGLKYTGFDFLVTSNNHSIDTEEKGLRRTLDVIDAHGLGHTGTYRSPEDRDSIRVVDIKGLRIAILNYTYGTNGLPVPEGKPWLINQIDTTLIRKDIEAARAHTTAELVMVIFHFGTEYAREPDAWQKDAVKSTFNSGADIVIGSHPHVLQPVEYYVPPKGRLKKSIIAWSLGNFFSNQGDRYKDAGMVLHLSLTKNFTKDSIWLSDVSYTPTWVYRGSNPAKKVHIVLPAEAALKPDSVYPYLTTEDRMKLKQAFEDSKAHLPKRMPELRMEPYPWNQ